MAGVTSGRLWEWAWAALVLVLVVPAAWCVSARASFPGANGRIALTAGVAGVEPLDPDFAWVVSIRADGDDPRVLAGPKARAPAFRSDGHMITAGRRCAPFAPELLIWLGRRVSATSVGLARGLRDGWRRVPASSVATARPLSARAARHLRRAANLRTLAGACCPCAYGKRDGED